MTVADMLADESGASEAWEVKHYRLWKDGVQIDVQLLRDERGYYVEAVAHGRNGDLTTSGNLQPTIEEAIAVTRWREIC